MLIDIDDLDKHTTTELCIGARELLRKASSMTSDDTQKEYQEALKWADAGLEVLAKAAKTCSQRREDLSLSPDDMDELDDIEQKARSYAIAIIAFAKSHGPRS